jgi:hypothetical protein
MSSSVVSDLVLHKDFHKLKLYIELGFEVSLTIQNGDSLEKFGTATGHAFNLVIDDRLKNIQRLRTQSLITPNDNGYTPLHWAIISHRNEIFNYLLEMVGDVSSDTSTGENSLTLAARYNNTFAFKKLLETQGSQNLFKFNERGFNALIFAAANKNTEIMQLCLEHASLGFIRESNNYGANFLHWFFHGQNIPDAKKKEIISSIMKCFLLYINKSELMAMLQERNGIDYTPLNWLEYYNCSSSLDFITRI